MRTHALPTLLLSTLATTACDGPERRPVGEIDRDEASAPSPVRGCLDYDLDGDGDVGFGDHLLLSQNFGNTVDGVVYDFEMFLGLSGWFGVQCPAPRENSSDGCLLRGDLDGSGTVDADDLALMERVSAMGSPRGVVLAVADVNGSERVGDGDVEALQELLEIEGGPPPVCLAPPNPSSNDGEIGSVYIAWGRILDADYDDRSVRGWLTMGGKRVWAMGKQTLETQCRQPDSDSGFAYETPPGVQLSEMATVELAVDEGLVIDSVEDCDGTVAIAENGRGASCTASLCALVATTPKFTVLSEQWNLDTDWHAPDGYVEPDCTLGNAAPPTHCCIGVWDYIGSTVECEHLGIGECNAEPSCYWDAVGTCGNLSEQVVDDLLPWGCDLTAIVQYDQFSCGGLPAWIQDCNTISTHYLGHGLGAARLTDLAYHVCRAADSCTTATVRDWGCETFYDFEHAQDRAEELAAQLAEAGQGDITVEVVGNRRVSAFLNGCVAATPLALRLSQSPTTFWVKNGVCSCEEP